MSTYINGQDLLNGALDIAGELTDGSSGYVATTTGYLDLIYKQLLAGGNIFGIDVADPWVWAMSRRPILFTMVPSIGNVAATVTQFSNNGTFSIAPVDVTGASCSVQGWFINLDGRDEWFKIAYHVSGSTSFQLDMPYTEQSITASVCTLVKLDYDLVDNSVVVDQYNQYVDFVEGSGSTKTATLTQGIYDPQSFATMVATALHAAGSLTYTGTWNSVSRLFTWAAGSNFSILNSSGPSVPYNASEIMGLDVLDYTGAASYRASYPLNAINRMVAPILTARKPNSPWRSPRDEGKIYEIGLNTFTREYPISMIQQGLPDRFCRVATSPTGIVTIRLNGFFDGNAGQPPSRLEVPYIPLRQAFQANSAFIPVIPEPYRKFLVDAAASMLMSDKKDNMTADRETKAKAGLMAMQNANRKDKSLNGQNYAKLVPRAGQANKRFWWSIT